MLSEDPEDGNNLVFFLSESGSFFPSISDLFELSGKQHYLSYQKFLVFVPCDVMFIIKDV